MDETCFMINQFRVCVWNDVSWEKCLHTQNSSSKHATATSFEVFNCHCMLTSVETTAQKETTTKQH